MKEDNRDDCPRVSHRNSHIIDMPFVAAMKSKKTLKLKKKEDL